MDCELARTALSALLDGEDPGVEDRRLERHVAGCAACAEWSERAGRLDRLVRVTPAVPPGPDLSDWVVGQVPADRRRRVLAVALAAVAVAQVVLGAVSLFHPIGMGMAMGAAHMDHESAAFNLAFGVALLVVVRDTGRARAQVPVLATFVAVLTVASLVDLTDGSVGWDRLATHLPVVAGLALVLALGRTDQARPEPDGARIPAVREGGWHRITLAERLAPHGDRQTDRPSARRRGVA